MPSSSKSPRRSEPLTLAVTLGDPAGIGPELVLRSREALESAAAARARVLIIGREDHLDFYAAPLKSPKFWTRIEAAELSGAGKGVFLIEPELSAPEQKKWNREQPAPGKMRDGNGFAAFAAVREAAEMAASGAVHAIATCPLNKTALQRDGVKFPGHTEMLARFSGTKRFGMFFDGGGLRVSLVTIHEPLRRAIRLITTQRVFDIIKLTAEFMRFYDIEKPRLAVAGLNPHAGEGGLIGGEDAMNVLPAIQRARKRGIDAQGPIPPDVVFYQALRGDYDAVVAMYHDQGLIPVKTLAFDSAVNITMGLPFIRTSPDHGTAYDIAGEGRADLQSFQRAVQLALDLARKRRRMKQS